MRFGFFDQLPCAGAYSERQSYFNQGGLMDRGTVRRSMTSFVRDVLPHCQ